MVDDVGAPDAEVGVSGVDPEGGASGVDVCQLAAADHESMYLLDLQVDPYTAELDDGQQMVVESRHMRIMVDPSRITVDQIFLEA